jgi:cyclopropane-fatty-acyl-phospholipid synthase
MTITAGVPGGVPVPPGPTAEPGTTFTPDVDNHTEPDPERWPDVSRVPRGPLGQIQSVIAAALVRRAARQLRLRIDEHPPTRGSELASVNVGSSEDPNVDPGDPNEPMLRLHRPEAFHRRLGADGLIGFGEAYQAGDWDAGERDHEDLPRLLGVFARQMDSLVPQWMQRLRRVHVARMPRSERNTVDGSKRNIHHHYDLSNDLFALFLDETMTYSSAIFDTGADGRPIASAETLPEAQRRKIDTLLDRVHVGPGTRLLEIGTGWGELAIRAAQRGAIVHTLTLSTEQRDLALRRVAKAGLADLVTVELRDYRELEAEPFQAIVSVEMIEAVGEQYWPAYFATLDRLLATGGRIGIQAITMQHHRLLATRKTYTWIQKYIFPGGIIPSVRSIEESCRRHTRLRVQDLQAFGTHYAHTLRLWRERFHQRRADVAALGFDETFRRTWHLYLSYCEAGFAAGYLDVHQLVLGRQE